jgi:transmembrane sensor
VTSLAAGRQFSAGPDHQTLSQPALAGKEQWIEGVQAFNDVPLAELVTETNRYARRPIVLDDPAMGTLHVSGTYRLRDTEQIADKLAALLDLSVAENPDAYRLHRR